MSLCPHTVSQQNEAPGSPQVFFRAAAQRLRPLSEKMDDGSLMGLEHIDSIYLDPE